MLVKEKQINKHNKLIVEKVEIEKLGVINALERLDYLILIKLFYIEPRPISKRVCYFSSLELNDPSLLDKSLHMTISVSGNKKRKIEELSDDTGKFSGY